MRELIEGLMEMVITSPDGTKTLVKGYITSFSLHTPSIEKHESIPFTIEGITNIELDIPKKSVWKTDFSEKTRSSKGVLIGKRETFTSGKWLPDSSKEFPTYSCDFVEAMRLLHAVDIDEDPELPKLPDLPEMEEHILISEEERVELINYLKTEKIDDAQAFRMMSQFTTYPRNMGIAHLATS